MLEKVDSSGKYLFVFLLVHLLGAFVAFLCSCIQGVVSEDVYLEYVYSIDMVVTLFTYIVLVMMCILYLVWIWRVHKEYRQLVPQYPLSPGGAIAHILIPFYNIVGLWTLYSGMARFLMRLDATTARHGMRIRFLIPFYYFAHLITTVVNRMGEDEEGVSWYIWGTGLDVLATLAYIMMFVAVTSGLNEAREFQQRLQAEEAEKAENAAEDLQAPAQPNEPVGEQANL